MNNLKVSISIFSIVLAVLIFSCSGVDSNETDKSEESAGSNEAVFDTRFKVDTVMEGMNVKLILNRKNVPVDIFSDFYLKVEGKDPHTVNISTDVSQGFVSQNKEPYYYGIKGMNGLSEIKLMLFYKDEEGERIKIGDILVPVEQKK